MNKNIIRIALTGGPCAGKTTALAKIVETYSDLGYLVYALPEVPTIFANASINFATPDRQYFYNIEKAVLKFQLQMEDTFLALAQSASKPVIIISDRGTMDISAYMDPAIWQAMLDELGLSEVKLRDARYDAVIHMVTAAIGAEQFYTTENNSARYESVEEARAVDGRILKAWTGHPQLQIVENNVDFGVKIAQVLSAIHRTAGIDDSLHIEQERRKLRVRLTGEIPYGVETEIHQVYTTSGDGASVRLRKRGLSGNYVYFLSQKDASAQASGQSIIVERQISPDEYLNRMNQIAASSIVQSHHLLRKSFIWAGQYFELDEVQGTTESQTLLEVKVPKGQEPKIPPFISVLEDVSLDPNYALL